MAGAADQAEHGWQLQRSFPLQPVFVSLSVDYLEKVPDFRFEVVPKSVGAHGGNSNALSKSIGIKLAGSKG